MQPYGVPCESRLVGGSQCIRLERPRLQRRPLPAALHLRAALGHVYPEDAERGRGAAGTIFKALVWTHVELMPMPIFPGKRGWGYDGWYLYAIFHAYGEPMILSASWMPAIATGARCSTGRGLQPPRPGWALLGKIWTLFPPTATPRPWGWTLSISKKPAPGSYSRFLFDNALIVGCAITLEDGAWTRARLYGSLCHHFWRRGRSPGKYERLEASDGKALRPDRRERI